MWQLRLRFVILAIFVILLSGGFIFSDRNAEASVPTGQLSTTRLFNLLDSQLSIVLWKTPTNTSNHPGGDFGSSEPGTAMHPNHPLLALTGGLSYDPVLGNRIENTTDGGLTWTNREAPGCLSMYSGDGVPAWLAATPGVTPVALFVSRCANGVLELGKSTDAGVTWFSLTPTPNINVDGFNNDREYIWTDHYPSSPYYGRTYLTLTLFHLLRERDYDTIAVRYSTDKGNSWNTPIATLVNPYEYRATPTTTPNHNAHASLAIQPDGAIVASWHRGRCCSELTPVINVENKVMWARSTDGGATFANSGTIVTVPLEQSVPSGSRSPGGFRWSDAPDISADPVDGTLYAVWVQYRTAGDARTAAVYLSRGTPDATCWTTPVIVYNDSQPLFQYMPWVAVSHDHVVHVTFGAGDGSNTSLAQYYFQSTDRGRTFSLPFRLSNGAYPPANFMGDYQAISVGGYNSAGSESILTTWTQTDGSPTPHPDRWARIGTFDLTPTPACGLYGNYTVNTGSASLVSGTTLVSGSQCDECTAPVALPFPFKLYGRAFSSARVSPNGTLQFESNYVEPSTGWDNGCLPDPNFSYTILPQWNDLDTSTYLSGCPAGGCGIYTSTSGGTGNRIFNIEWRACVHPVCTDKEKADGLCGCNQGTLVFEVRLYENPGADQSRFELVYQSVPSGGQGATVGVQRVNGGQVLQITCQTPFIVNNMLLAFTQPTCPTAPPCFIQFQDVPSTNTFYPYIRCLACRGVIGGYPCGGPGEACVCPDGYAYFRPYNNITRGQLAKLVAIAGGFDASIPATQRTFQDLLPFTTFWVYVERLAGPGYVSGYPCGGPGEPCPGQYYRPDNNVTRGQIAKIVAQAAGYREMPSSQTFEDVPLGSTFYVWVEQIASRGIIGGYPCGGPGEPCVPPNNRPYFRPNSNATRGQAAKIVKQAFFPDCEGMDEEPEAPNVPQKIPASPTMPPGVTVTPAPTYTTPTPWLPSPVPTVLLPSPVPTVPAPTIPVPTAEGMDEGPQAPRATMPKVHASPTMPSGMTVTPVPASPTMPPGMAVTPVPTHTTPTPWLPSPVPTVLLPSPVPTVPAPTIPVPTTSVP